MNYNNKKRVSPEAKRLWDDFLKSYPIRFAPQKVVENFYADFYCREAKIVIELDKSQGYVPDGTIEENIRSENIQELDLLVICLSYKLINENFNGVCLYIDRITKERVK